MNPRHAAAVLLLAFGAFALLVGCIGGGVGIARWAGEQQGMANFYIGWVACTGVLPLLLGTALLVAGVRLYRASDHRLGEVRDRRGRVVRRALPVLSPLWLATFVLVTLLGAVLLLEGRLDAWSPKAVVAAVRYALIVCVLVAALAGWAYRRTKGRASDSPAEKGDRAGEEGGPKPTE